MSDVCPHCGRCTSVPRISGSEVVLNIACIILVFSVSFLTYRIADHWLDLQSDKISHQLLWREPLQSWDW